MCALVLLVSCVKFDVAITAPFVFEKALAVVTLERHLITVHLEREIIDHEKLIKMLM